MAKTKHLSKRQLDLIEDLFDERMLEQEVLEKYNVGRNLFNKWLLDETFTEQLDRRIAASYRSSAIYIARYAPLAAAKLVQLTDSSKVETARRACLDIISMNLSGENLPRTTAAGNESAQAENPLPFSADIAGKLLAVLADEKHRTMNSNRP
jgi:hypothetical protein